MTTSLDAARAQGAPARARVAPPRVLVVDERRLVADALRIALAERGDLAVPVAAPADAVTVARRTSPQVAVVHVRGHDSLRTVDELRSARPALPVLVLADRADAHDVRAAAASGAYGYLTSADDVAAVVAAVHDALAGRRGAAARRIDDAGRCPRAAGDQELTDREREVLARLVRGESTVAIATGLGVSPNTARTHIQRVLAKLQVHSRLEAAACATRDGLT